MSIWLSQEDLVPESLLPAVKKEVKGDIHNIKNADKIAQLVLYGMDLVKNQPNASWYGLYQQM